MGIEKPDQKNYITRDAYGLASRWDYFHSDTTATRKDRRCVRCLILVVLPILVIHARVLNSAAESGFLLRT